MAIKIQGQTVIDNNQNINVDGTVTATNFILSDGSSANGGAVIIVLDTAPDVAGLEEGALWWNSSADDASLYILYIDPDSAVKQWIELVLPQLHLIWMLMILQQKLMLRYQMLQLI